MHRRRSDRKPSLEARSDHSSHSSRNTAPKIAHNAELKPLQNSTAKTLRDRSKSQWVEDALSSQRTSAIQLSLTRLIEQDAPLQTHSLLVLMYGPFQAEMAPEAGQGVASWIKDCLRKHGLPSLVRFDYRRRAQVFRRDQFQSWLEPLMIAE
ncbi:MAG: hypothetical protein KME16_24660 [Scytolyngbya sp. HA4215-MV1]|jgi:hypothetical protein|nr:hypothetical protein [Scytolyngbya sp. HA4215-MV1]